MNALVYCEIDTAVGPMTLIKHGDYLIRIDFGTLQDKREGIEKWCVKHSLPTEMVEAKQGFELVIAQLEEYFKGERKHFSIDYIFYGTAFQKKVWKALTTIRYGKTCSYLDIANHIGAPKAVRAVGGANNNNPLSIIVPCHRVIGKNGKMVGYGGGLDKKEYLLELEQSKIYSP